MPAKSPVRTTEPFSNSIGTKTRPPVYDGVAHMHDNIAVRTSHVVRTGEQRVNLLKSFASVNQFSAFVCSNNRFNFSCNIGSRKSEMLEQNIAGSRSSKAFH